MLADVENSQVERELCLIWLHKSYSKRSRLSAMTLQLGRDVKCVIMTLQTKKHPRRKDDDVDALSAKRVRYDLEATLPHLGIYGREKVYSLMQLRGGILNCE